MIREIEFRGKRGDNEEWITSNSIQNTPFGNVYLMDAKRLVDMYNVNKFPTDIWVDVIPETVGQYTGLKDKNGVQIFDGDILKEGNQIILVLWNEKYASFTLHCNNWACLSFFYEDINPENCEVVGNNIDNPELLNK